MLRVRELAELARRLDATMFQKQMGPFALVQRPRPDAQPPPSAEASPARPSASTNVLPVLRLRGAPATAVDFGDLIVATLPPPDGDGNMELIIGRSPDCDLIIDDVSVSAHHAAVTWDGTAAVIKELGSANGTFINTHKMKDRWTLRDGDAVDVGKSHFLYMLAPSLHRRMRSMTGSTQL
jgi:hypothetical protein